MKSILFFLLLILPLEGLAENDAGPLGFGNSQLKREMETDRPDFTEATSTIEPGHMQFEMGLSFTEDDESDTEEFGAPELLVRIGLLQDLELRFEWGGYRYIDDDANQTIEGVSDLSVGFKHAIYEQGKYNPDVSLIIALKTPVGSNELTADEAEPALKLLLAYDIDEQFSLGSNINFTGPVEDGDRFFQQEVSLALGIALTESLGSYLEFIGIYTNSDASSSKPLNSFSGGFTYALSQNLQLDIFSGFGISSRADDFFTGLGLSFRI